MCVGRMLDVRWAEGDYTRFAALAFELLERKSSVIIVTTIAAARAAQQVAPATPLVMTGLIDPVGVGLIASLCPPSALMRQIGWVEEGRISGSS
jgi:putative ABC transport system substrate-binding protein